MHELLRDNSVGRHVNATSRKSLEIQAYSITKTRTLPDVSRIDSFVVCILVTSRENQQFMYGLFPAPPSPFIFFKGSHECADHRAV